MGEGFVRSFDRSVRLWTLRVSSSAGWDSFRFAGEARRCSQNTPPHSSPLLTPRIEAANSPFPTVSASTLSRGRSPRACAPSKGSPSAPATRSSSPRRPPDEGFPPPCCVGKVEARAVLAGFTDAFLSAWDTRIRYRPSGVAFEVGTRHKDVGLEVRPRRNCGARGLPEIQEGGDDDDVEAVDEGRSGRAERGEGQVPGTGCRPTPHESLLSDRAHASGEGRVHSDDDRGPANEAERMAAGARAVQRKSRLSRYSFRSRRTL